MPLMRSSASTTPRARVDLAHDRGDLAGGLLGPLGELAHFGGHDGEAAPVLAGAGSLDGGVERQQVGLVGEVVDDLEDAADLVALLAQGQRTRGDGVDPRGDGVHRTDAG
jgi:hypothetical protein